MRTKLLRLINHLLLHWRKIGKRIPLVILIAGCVLTAYFFYTKYQETATLLASAQEKLSADSDENKNVVLDKIKAMIELPDEEPSIATVTDVESIRNQPFFVKAKNDDVVVIFYKEAKALLYRPSDNKIINWAFVDTGGQTTTEAGGQVAGAASNADLPTPSPSPQPGSVTVALYNGTTRGGLTNIAQEQIADKLPEVKAITKTNAVKNNYKKTLVIDVNGDNQILAKKIAFELGGEIESLPEGEATSSAQVVIILGEDFQK